MDNNLDMLLKTYDDSKDLLDKSNSRKYNLSKSKILNICKSLCKNCEDYKAEKTVKSIESYINNPNKIQRLLYSEISNYILGLDEEKRGTFGTNVEKLLIYSLNNTEISDDCRKIIIKIYDHFQLILSQSDNVNKILEKGIVEAKIKIKYETQKIEREYITILGIFAAIVLAFVGNITFSSSVLENISSGSVYRVIGVSIIIGFVFFNIVYIMIDFIKSINSIKSSKSVVFWVVNIIFIIGILLNGIAYKYYWFERKEEQVISEITTIKESINEEYKF